MNYCPYCVRAKSLLEQRGIAYQEINTDSWSDDQWNDLVKKSRMKTLPQIFHGDDLIGGYTELAALDAKDKLKGIGATK